MDARAEHLDESSTAPLASLTPDPRNARTHDERNLTLIEADLREVGASRSIVVDEIGTILAGNATVAATQKPVELIRRLVEYHTGAGEAVYEPFAGSGTALVACEQLGRRCFALEVSPAFCDVVVQRWEELTGKQAERESGGEDATECHRI